MLIASVLEGGQFEGTLRHAPVKRQVQERNIGPQKTHAVQHIAELERAEQALRLIVEGTSAKIGEEFFRSAVKHLAEALGVQFAFITRLADAQRKRLRLVACWMGAEHGPLFEYDIAGTPCEGVISGKLSFYPDRVQQRFPDDEWAAQNGIVSYLAIPLFDSAGAVSGHMGVAHTAPMSEDLRAESILRVFAARAGGELERQRTEESLRRSHNLLTAVIEGTSNPVFVTDIDGRYVLVNSKAAKIMGRPVEAIIGKHDADLFPPELARTIVEEDRNIIASGESGSFLREGIVVSGERRSYLVTKSLYYDHDGQPLGIVGIAHDITARKGAEDKLRQREAQLAHLSRLTTVGEMTAGLAHEINQPLAAIVNYAGGCIENIDAHSEESKALLDVLHKISTQAERASEIIRRLRMLVRKHPSTRLEIDLNTVIRETIDLIGFEIRSRQILVQLQLDESLPVIVADDIQIQQVLLNLIQNALEAMDETAKRRARLIVRTAMLDGGFVEVQVCDTGTTLSDEARERLFDPFFTTKPTGIGLGLPISRTLIEAHGGRLSAAPSPGGGTTFRFTLPVD
ncbi:MAG: PAS domain-containing protein [Planctomycetes bacterium]|nr:PAS domain-containing protein [Planctomycetota bacterium]